MEERLSWDTQILRIILKEKLLDKSQVPHAPSTCKKAPDCCLNEILKFYWWASSIRPVSWNTWHMETFTCLQLSSPVFLRLTRTTISKPTHSSAQWISQHVQQGWRASAGLFYWCMFAITSFISDSNTFFLHLNCIFYTLIIYHQAW